MRLLLVLPLRAHAVDGQTFIDLQACNGLRLWLSNFEAVTLACPTIYQAVPNAEFGAIDDVPGSERLTFVALPVTYTPYRFAVAMPRTARLLRKHIAEADYLHFAIGGLWGDWASLACLLTRRPYAVWTDRVEHRVVAFSAASKTGVRRLYTKANAKLIKHYQRLVIRRAALGLFHGADSFNAYAKHCRNPHLVHNVHTNVIARLQGQSKRMGPLRIAYAGRVHREKGVFDWIDALSNLTIPFEATWFGDGAELAEAQRRSPPSVSFPGPLPHGAALDALKTFDVFVFCHKTPESPRCLIEALQCGLPIIGYDSAYPRDLVRKHGGGILTAPNSPNDLARILAELASDKARLADLKERALADGALFTDEGVFRHRAELMKSIAA